MTPWIIACQASLSFTVSWSLLRLMNIELVMPSNHLILCRPLLLLPSIVPSIRVFSNESAPHIRWPKYWSFSFSPSDEDLGLISFRMDWFDLLAVQGTLKKSSPAPQFKSIDSLMLSLLTVQLSHPYMTTGKPTALTTSTFVSKVMSLLFLALSKIVMDIFPRSKSLLILWLNFWILIQYMRNPFILFLINTILNSLEITTVKAIIFKCCMNTPNI